MSNKYQKRKSKITFIIGTLNEEKRIIYPVKSFLRYGNVLVVDHYSTDRTVEVAKRLGAKVIKYKNLGWSETKEQMDFIFDHVTTDWICIASADEMIPETCLKLYKKIANEAKYKIVVQRKKTLLYEGGRDFINAYINVHFFKKGALDYTAKSVHERKFASDVKPSEVLYLPPLDEYSIYHFSVYTSDSFVNTLKSYAPFHSLATGKKFLRLKMLLIPAVVFFSHFFFGRLYKIGIRGLIFSIESAFYYFFTYSKAYEIHNNINFASIEKSFLKDKVRLLKASPKSSLLKKMMARLEIAMISFIHKKYKFKEKKKLFSYSSRYDQY